MGIDVRRFVVDVDEELLCPICSNVLDDAVQAPVCEHAYCRGCISEWLKQQPTCPVDRQTLISAQLAPVPRILRNLLGRLVLACENADDGCAVNVRLDAIQQHFNECPFNPERPVTCEKGCALVLPRNKIGEHNCVKDLRGFIDVQSKRIEEIQHQVTDHQYVLNSQASEINILKNTVRLLAASKLTPVGSNVGHNQASASANPSLPDDFCEIQEWATSLALARVSRWGGVISTPDGVLQAVIRRSLLESGCPPGVTSELMVRAHERSWPNGLQSLSARQMNRTYYSQFVARRVPGKQAVVILQCENRSLPRDMIAQPGIIMIFAHGVD